MTNASIQLLTSALERRVVEVSLPKEETLARRQDICSTLLSQSRYLREPNFTCIHPDDLDFLFREYDRLFFEGWLGKSVSVPGRDLSFRLSSRMTKVGGTTTHRRLRGRFPGRGQPVDSYEIAVSTTLLYQTFDGLDHRPIVVCGSECSHRLDALLRIFEHELIHLAELMLWNDSKCSESRFQSLAFRLFSHTGHTHALITPRERALVQYDVRPGDRVRFPFDGETLCGVVNRITRRATILVEHPGGERYSDGRRYRKYFVPLPVLERVG